MMTKAACFCCYSSAEGQPTDVFHTILFTIASFVAFSKHKKDIKWPFKGHPFFLPILWNAQYFTEIYSGLNG